MFYGHLLFFAVNLHELHLLAHLPTGWVGVDPKTAEHPSGNNGYLPFVVRLTLEMFT